MQTVVEVNFSIESLPTQTSEGSVSPSRNVSCCNTRPLSSVPGADSDSVSARELCAINTIAKENANGDKISSGSAVDAPLAIFLEGIGLRTD